MLICGIPISNQQSPISNGSAMSMLHEITAAAPRFKKSQRKGRGESSGRGKTSGRGTKGAKARVGKYVKRGHEHGQTPIYRRLPKRGFSNFDFENRFHVVNLSELERFADGATVDAIALIDAGLVPDDRRPVKILGDGAISKKLTVVAGWYSRSAHEKISAAGGSAQNVKGEAFEFPKPKKRFVPREKPAGKKKQQQAEAPAEAEAAKPAEPGPAAAE
jgi:large subunit ribosomal protein L15